MSKDDWNGGSGWGAITDPTSVLSGRVLVASAGVSQTTQDYLVKDIGTSTDFTAIHYSSRFDYALLSTPSFANGKLGAISRASAISGGLASNAYQAYFDVASGYAYIDKVYGGVTTTLASARLPASITSVSTKHTLELKTYGLDPVTIQLFVDDTILVNIGDTSSTKLTSGYPGIMVYGSSAYVDNFAILEYTADGTAAANWTPIELTSSVLSVWLKSDTGVTTVTSSPYETVSLWADQSGNSNDAIQATPAARPIQLATTASGSINNFPGIDFLYDGSTNNYLDIATASTIDMNSSGVSIFVMINPDVTSGTGTIADKTSSAAPPVTSYQLVVGSGSTDGLEFTGASTVQSSASILTTSNYQIAGVISNIASAAIAETYGFWVNGTQQGNLTIGLGADNTNPLRIGASMAGTNGLNGKIVEIIVIKGELSIGNRQKVEGYLAHRYNTFTDLPSNHPYRNTAPTV